MNHPPVKIEPTCAVCESSATHVIGRLKYCVACRDIILGPSDIDALTLQIQDSPALWRRLAPGPRKRVLESRT